MGRGSKQRRTQGKANTVQVVAHDCPDNRKREPGLVNYSPEHGWHIYEDMGGMDVFHPIKFCPFCGAKLE